MNSPLRPAPVARKSMERLEAWLRYSKTLGMDLFYLNRAYSAAPAAPQISQPSDFSAAPEISAVSEVAATPATSGAPAVPKAPIAQKPVAASAPAAAPIFKDARKAAPPVLVSSPPLPIVAAPSFFDAKIEGDTLAAIRADIGDCTRCRLHLKRTKIVFGSGNPQAQLMFVGEGPGRDEDLSGEPFVGRAGKLLTQMIEAMGLRRPDVYIANVVKCRPPENRQPEKDETATCSPFLIRQIDVIAPKVIVCLGSTAAQFILDTPQSISRFRGEWFDYRGSRVLATYHPAYLLRNPNAKGDVWKDLQKVMAVLGLDPKPKQQSAAAR
ncbi:MAG: uracil-DNA glycosylase [Candidatus Acidiferrales bacterium]